MMNIITILNSLDDIITSTPVSALEISSAENQLGLHFSEEYKLYTSQFGRVLFDGHELTGVCNSERLGVVPVTLEERDNNPEGTNDMYVIERLNIDGVVIWQDSEGLIYQSLPNSPLIQINKSLSEYISGCIQ